MSLWPVGLPQKPLREGFQRTKFPNKVQTEMDSGPTKSRRFQSIASFIYNVTFELDQGNSELDTFWTFYDTTTLSGTEEFEWVDPLSGTNYYWVFYGDEPVETPVGGNNYRVTFQLERKDPVI
jgi:hypothetical protein